MICQLVHSLNYGGAECLARDFALHGAADLRFAFACLDQAGPMADPLAQAGFDVEPLARRPGFDLRCVLRLARFCEQLDVRVIHAHQYAPFFYASLASRLAGGIPVLFTEHGREYPDRPRPKRKLANRFLLRSRDRVVAVSDSVRRALIANEAIRDEAIQVIPNGIDTESFARPARTRSLVRAELAISQDAFLLVQVARLDRLKDHATSFRALARLRSAYPSVQLLLVGDGEERAALERLAVRLGIDPVVRFAGARTDIVDLLHASDLFLLSSLSEGIPLTLLEAMAAGLPSVATDVGGVSEVLEDRKTGLLAQAGNPAHLAQQLAELIERPVLRQELAHAGQHHVQRFFDAWAMHRAYDRLYRSMMGPLTVPPQPSRVPAPMGLWSQRQARSV